MLTRDPDSMSFLSFEWYWQTCGRKSIRYLLRLFLFFHLVKLQIYFATPWRGVTTSLIRTRPRFFFLKSGCSNTSEAPQSHIHRPLSIPEGSKVKPRPCWLWGQLNQDAAAQFMSLLGQKTFKMIMNKSLWFSWKKVLASGLWCQMRSE